MSAHKKVSVNNGQVRIANATMGGARKPSGPINYLNTIELSGHWGIFEPHIWCGQVFFIFYFNIPDKI